MILVAQLLSNRFEARKKQLENTIATINIVIAVIFSIIVIILLFDMNKYDNAHHLVFITFQTVFIVIIN